MEKRIFADIVLLLSVLILPWWVAFACAIFFIFIFESFYEILFFGLIIDTLYGIPLGQFFGFQFVFLTLAAILLALSLFLRKKIVFYPGKF